jgi:hypothetical protein
VRRDGREGRPHQSSPLGLKGQYHPAPVSTTLLPFRCCLRRVGPPPGLKAGLVRAVAILGDFAQIVHPTVGAFDLSSYNSVEEAIVSIITRQLQVVERYGARFWSAAGAQYPKSA